jgi:3-phosphoshikimate 1-carboxyvinyltransferase
MALRILRSVVGGEAVAPPSKSYTHRAFALAALTGERCEIRRPLISEDTSATLSAVGAMGAEVETGAGVIRIDCPAMHSPRRSIDARNSGTTLRLISGVAALLDGKTSITGDASLQKRPMKPLLGALRDLGAKCSGTGETEHPPVTIRGPMTGTSARISGNISSQFVSSLLIACPMKDTPTELEITGAQKSRSYIDISLFMLEKFRIEVEKVPNGFSIPGGQRPIGSRFTVPGDFSSAAFLLCAGAITGGTVTVKGLDASMPQGDLAITEALQRYGADVEIRDDSVTCRPEERRPFEFDVGDSPDLFPVLGVLAATAKGESRLSGGEHLRFKESDRISTTVRMLKSLGVEARALDDGCIVRGDGKIAGGTVDTQMDHRIMMAATIAGLVSVGGVMLEDEKSYEVSFPTFLDEVQRLGAIVQAVKQ